MSDKRTQGSRLSKPDFKREHLAEAERAAVLEHFGGQGLVEDVLGVIGDGKEATVYACTANPSVGFGWVAAKVYRAQKFRAFTGARVYAGERTALDARARRAMKHGTRTGRRLAHHEWIAWEWQALCRLHDAGADVPKPLACSEDAILMELASDGNGPAPQLRHVRMGGEEARRLLHRLLENLEIFLDCHLVHGDLSAYNVLYADARPWIIDLPQSIDARTRSDAYEYLLRDVRNLERWFEAHGLSAGAFAHEIWQRYRRGALGR